MKANRREARILTGPHGGQTMIAALDESDSVIAVFYEERNGGLVFVADYWFETFRDMEEAIAEMGWLVEWLP